MPHKSTSSTTEQNESKRELRTPQTYYWREKSEQGGYEVTGGSSGVTKGVEEGAEVAKAPRT